MPYSGKNDGMPACASKGKKKPAFPEAWLTAGGRCAHWEAGVLEKKTALRHAWYSDVTNQPEPAMEQIPDRQLIEHLFGRVETLEGRLLEYRAVCASLIRALPEVQMRAVMQFLALAQADALTVAALPQGYYLRGSETLARNQTNGMQTESNSLRELVQALA